MAGSKRKKNLGLLLLLVVMILLLGVYFWVAKNNNGKKDAADDTADKNKAIVTMDSASIKTIYFKNKDFEMTMKLNSKGVWEDKDNASFPVNQTYASNMQSLFTTITPTNTLTDDISDLSAFGLDNPAITATATAEDGKEVTITVGNESPLGGEYYAQVKGNKAVYLVNASYYSYFAHTKSEMITVETLPSITAANITGLSVAAKDGKEFDVEYEPDSPYDYSGFSDYIMKKPYATPVAADSDSLTTLFGNYASLSYQSCEDYNAADLSKYGLDKPAYTVAIKYYEEKKDSSSTDSSKDASSTDSTDSSKTATKVSKSLTLLIGKANEDGDYYVKTSDSNAVNVMSKSTVDKIVTVDAFSNVYKYTNLINIDNVNSIDIVSKGVTHTLSIKRETKKEDKKDVTTATYYIDNKKVEEDPFKKIYAQVITPKIQREIPQADLGKGKNETPDMTLTFHLTTTDTPFVVEFKPYDDSYDIVNSNGTELFLMDSRDIQTVLSAISTK
ncbi:DUF4340 domain-containing protein [Anaerocolumna chitinilytica]|uniref:DUF4340 domain-containing protein n=1 Tax=Anaerocolumna chitinilytica TaxID=1727145 RepID=A0A7I8DHS5_9FIRM|nr:DUF4340 domain-containing protein [Anaerocolumna chitinilytica]BCJ97882.1 hypothetical protein bsdcttw_09230 [Anaerocolumna chitinilytica]